MLRPHFAMERLLLAAPLTQLHWTACASAASAAPNYTCCSCCTALFELPLKIVRNFGGLLLFGQRPRRGRLPMVPPHTMNAPFCLSVSSVPLLRAFQLALPGGSEPPSWLQRASQLAPGPSQLAPGPSHLGLGPSQMAPGPSQVVPGPSQLAPRLTQLARRPSQHCRLSRRCRLFLCGGTIGHRPPRRCCPLTTKLTE